MSAKNGTADEDGAASENHTVNSSNNHEMSSDSIVPILPPIAPADGLGLDRVNDILDFEIEHIFNDRATRNEHYQCLSFFWNTHPAKSIGFGRRFVLLLLAEIMVIACGRPPLDNDENDGIQKRFPALYSLDREGWLNLESDLTKVRSLLLRKDATVNYSNERDGLNDASQVDLEISKSEEFGVKFDKIVRLIQINKAIAPFRKALEDGIIANVENVSSIVTQESIAEVIRYLESEGNAEVQDSVRSLFVETNQGSFCFVDHELLVSKIRAPPFDLVYFQNKFETLLHRMTDTVFPKDQSVLMALRYTVTPNSAIDEILRTRRKNRKRIISTTDVHRRKRTRGNSQASHVPMSDDAVHSPSQQSQTANDQRNVGSHAIVEEMDETEQLMEGTGLGRPMKRARISPLRKRDNEVAPDPGIFHENGRVARRQRWTEQEKNIVRIGVKRFGPGHWKEIKNAYPQILRNRTVVQIKDCWRTMSKSGELTLHILDGSDGSEPETNGDMPVATKGEVDVHET